jgi:hypothetical protein
MFILHFLLSLGFVFLFGGIFVVINKWMEHTDDLFLDDKIGSWMQAQTIVTVQIFPPSQNARSLSEMENFFINLHSIYSKRSIKDIRIDGKWYDTFAFEIHSRGGQIGFFCHLNKNYLPLFRSALTAHYPGTGIIETPDPIRHWPRKWEGAVGKYKHIYSTDLEFGNSKDYFPLKSWKAFQKGNDSPISDPINVLIKGFEDIDPEDYIIFQILVQPNAVPDGKKAAWKNGLIDLKKEYTNNATVETNEAGQVQVLTKLEKEIIDSVESRIQADAFKTKLRVMLLSENPAPVRLLGRVMTFLKEFAGERQFLKPAKDAKTNITDDGDRFGFLGPRLGVWLDEFYWKIEQDFRLEKMYLATIRRSVGRGVAPIYLTAEMLAALFHFPITSNTTLDNGSPSQQPLDYDTGQTLLLGSQPPNNLPT